MLKLYIDLNDRQAVRQVEGLLRVKTDPLLRRVATPGPITFARGLQITLEFDETSYEGTGVFLLGGVL